MSQSSKYKSSAADQFQVVAVAGLIIVVTLLLLAFGSSVLGWSTLMMVGVAAAVIAVVGIGLAVTYRWWGQSAALRALRDTSGLSDVTGAGALAKGAELRGWDGDRSQKKVDPTDVAMLIGKVGKKPVYKTLEDFTLIIMGPRSNKTSSQAVPRILAALGSVVCTSNKPDLWILTSDLRREVGPVYAFDPGSIAFVEQTFWWNILGEVKDFKSAKRVATHFMAGVGSGNKESGNAGFFESSSKQFLARMFLAAAVSGRSMRDVISWVDTASREPVGLLEELGMQRFADALDSQLSLVPETFSGVQGGAAAALECLQDEDMLRWITPPQSWEQKPSRTIPELDLWSLFASPDDEHSTLYLMSQEGAESAGPIVAALVDAIFKLSQLASSAQGGRCDPPMTMVLDEAANICRIKDLPDQASHLGSRGILVDVILQSYQQGMGVWGRERMGALWGASTCRIVGAGLQERDDAKMVSDLVGTHEVWKVSHQRGPGGSSTGKQKVREAIMPLEDVAALDRAHALLIRQGSRPVLMELLPWYQEQEAAENIGRMSAAAVDQIRDSAASMLAGNALGRKLREQYDLPGGAR